MGKQEINGVFAYHKKSLLVITHFPPDQRPLRATESEARTEPQFSSTASPAFLFQKTVGWHP